MNENIIDDRFDEDEELEIKQPEKIEKKSYNYENYIKIFLILGIISLILLVISLFLSKVLLLIFVALTSIFLVLLIISIIFKIKKDKKDEEERIKRLKLEEKKRKEEEEERIKKLELEEQKRKEEERKKKEEERINMLKQKMLENEKKLRENKEIVDTTQLSEKERNEQLNEVLEDMCIYGNIMKKQIQEEKEKNPEKFIDTSKALELENQDPGLFALGLISQNLEELGIETAIEKEENKEEEDAGAACLQFITNGLAEKKKYDLHFEFDEKRNEELLDNEEEYEKFKENLKLKLSKDYNIPVDKIVVTFPQKGSLRVQVIFQSSQFNDLDLNQFKNNFKNDSEFKELCNLKDIQSDVIMGGCKLLKSQLDPRGNRNDGWGVGENRGGKPYDPPIGWNGIGLKVWDKYGDNTWLGMNNSSGEWCVAYHGVGRGNSSDNVKNITGKIFKGGFKVGQNQVHENCNDIFHPGKKVGSGVYCTPTISTAEKYSGVSNINGISYKTVLMVRVNPKAIRHCSDSGDYWVVDGTTNEIRPYRILYKKC